MKVCIFITFQEKLNQPYMRFKGEIHTSTLTQDKMAESRWKGTHIMTTYHSLL